MPSTLPPDDARRLAARRLTALRARLRRARRRALGAAGASFVLALAAVFYQQHLDERAATAATQTGQTTTTTTTSGEATDVQAEFESSSDDAAEESTLDAPATAVS